MPTPKPTREQYAAAILEATQLLACADLPSGCTLGWSVVRSDDRTNRVTLKAIATRPRAGDRLEPFLVQICICGNPGCIGSTAERTGAAIADLARKLRDGEIEFTLTPTD